MKFFDKLRGEQAPIPARASVRAIVLAWLGCALTIGLLACLQSLTQEQRLIMMAPFGASCGLVFGYPDAPFSQPRSVVGGHCLSAFIGLALLALCGPVWWAMALGVATAVAAMMWLGVMHPPAGATVLSIFLTLPSWKFLLLPTLLGSVLIVLVALAYNNLTRTAAYPKYW